MAKRNGASMADASPNLLSSADPRQAAYRAAAQEMAVLQPGEAMLYHEGHLAIDIGHDPAIAGRAAAFWDATEADRGIMAQRRLGCDRYQYIFWRGRHDRR